MADMTPDQLKEYATALILEHARDIEYLSIFEMAEEYGPTGDISDEDAKRVDKLIGLAKVTVEFPEVTR